MAVDVDFCDFRVSRAVFEKVKLEWFFGWKTHLMGPEKTKIFTGDHSVHEGSDSGIWVLPGNPLQ